AAAADPPGRRGGERRSCRPVAGEARAMSAAAPGLALVAAASAPATPPPAAASASPGPAPPAAVQGAGSPSSRTGVRPTRASDAFSEWLAAALAGAATAPAPRELGTGGAGATHAGPGAPTPNGVIPAFPDPGAAAVGNGAPDLPGDALGASPAAVGPG